MFINISQIQNRMKRWKFSPCNYKTLFEVLQNIYNTLDSLDESGYLWLNQHRMYNELHASVSRCAFYCQKCMYPCYWLSVFHAIHQICLNLVFISQTQFIHLFCLYSFYVLLGDWLVFWLQCPLFNFSS